MVPGTHADPELMSVFNFCGLYSSCSEAYCCHSFVPAGLICHLYPSLPPTAQTQPCRNGGER
jgi:hypothetical protein